MTILEIFDGLKKAIESNHSDVSVELHQQPPHLGNKWYCLVTVGICSGSTAIQQFKIDPYEVHSLDNALEMVDLHIKSARERRKK